MAQLDQTYADRVTGVPVKVINADGLVTIRYQDAMAMEVTMSPIHFEEKFVRA